MPIRVLIADDQAMVRAGLRVLVESSPEFEVVGEAADGEQAIAAVAETDPDVVLMDIRMPVMDGLEATRRIASSSDGGRPRIIVLTTFGTDEYVYEALSAGASGFLLKDAGPARLYDAITVVHGGDALLDPAITRRLIAELTSRPDAGHVAPPELTTLTEREREVLVLVGEGLTNDEIAQRLFVSVATAKKHVSNAMLKLHARDRAQLVVIAYRAGLVR